MALNFSSAVSSNVFFATSNFPIMFNTTDVSWWGDTRETLGTQVPMNVGPGRPRIRWDRGGEPDSIRDKSIFTIVFDKDED
jgi:hypothetical protein